MRRQGEEASRKQQRKTEEERRQPGQGAAPNAVRSGCHGSRVKASYQPYREEETELDFPQQWRLAHAAGATWLPKVLLGHLVHLESWSSFRRLLCDPSSRPPCLASDLCFPLTSPRTQRAAGTVKTRSRSSLLRSGTAVLQSNFFSALADTPPACTGVRLTLNAGPEELLKTQRPPTPKPAGQTLATTRDATRVSPDSRKQRSEGGRECVDWLLVMS